MIGKLIVGILVLGLIAYGVMWLFNNFSILQLASWLFIGVMVFILFFVLAALMKGVKTDG